MKSAAFHDFEMHRERDGGGEQKKGDKERRKRHKIGTLRERYITGGRPGPDSVGTRMSGMLQKDRTRDGGLPPF